MDGYKKIIRSQKVRMSLLKMLSFVPDKWMIHLQYYIKLKRKLDLKNPKRFTEKLQWYKLYYRKPIMTQCVDKYAVREYVEKCDLSNILTKLYGVYNSVDEIDFSVLPEKFIIKTTNGSGTNIICTNKYELDLEQTCKKLKDFMNRPTISAGREWAYYDVPNKIIIEELLEDTDNPYGGVNDYKFICFNGKAYCVVVDVGRMTFHQRNFYDMNWERIDVESDHENFEPDVQKPVGFEQMVEIAQKLSKGFPFVRVDLYNVGGKIYFGELTFYPWSGYVQYKPDSFDFELGEQFKNIR